MRKEDRSLKSVFEDSKRYIEELQLDWQFNDGATLIGKANQVVTVKEPENIKEILRKTTKQERRTAVMEQPWVGKYVTQHWKDPEIAPASYQTLKEWRNIPDIVLSVDTSIIQQLINTKTYIIEEKRYKRVLIKSTSEYAPMIKKQYPTSYVVAEKWHKHSTRKDTTECYDHYTIAYWKSMSLVNLKTLYLGVSKAKVLWDIPWHLEKCPRNGANKPDMSVLDKMNEEWGRAREQYQQGQCLKEISMRI